MMSVSKESHDNSSRLVMPFKK